MFAEYAKQVSATVPATTLRRRKAMQFCFTPLVDPDHDVPQRHAKPPVHGSETFHSQVAKYTENYEDDISTEELTFFRKHCKRTFAKSERKMNGDHGKSDDVKNLTRRGRQQTDNDAVEKEKMKLKIREFVEGPLPAAAPAETPTGWKSGSSQNRAARGLTASTNSVQFLSPSPNPKPPHRNAQTRLPHELLPAAATALDHEVSVLTTSIPIPPPPPVGGGSSSAARSPHSSTTPKSTTRTVPSALSEAEHLLQDLRLIPYLPIASPFPSFIPVADVPTVGHFTQDGNFFIAPTLDDEICITNALSKFMTTRDAGQSVAVGEGGSARRRSLLANSVALLGMSGSPEAQGRRLSRTAAIPTIETPFARRMSLDKKSPARPMAPRQLQSARARLIQSVEQKVSDRLDLPKCAASGGCISASEVHLQALQAREVELMQASRRSPWASAEKGGSPFTRRGSSMEETAARVGPASCCAQLWIPRGAADDSYAPRSTLRRILGNTPPETVLAITMWDVPFGSRLADVTMTITWANADSVGLTDTFRSILHDSLYDDRSKLAGPYLVCAADPTECEELRSACLQRLRLKQPQTAVHRLNVSDPEPRPSVRLEAELAQCEENRQVPETDGGSELTFPIKRDEETNANSIV